MRRPANVPPVLRDAEVFTTTEAVQAGLTSRQLQNTSVVRLGRSLYRPNDVSPSRESEVRGWMRILPTNTALYGRSAAAWWGLPVDDHGVLHVVTPDGETRPRKRPGLVSHSGSGAVTELHGVHVTVPARTFIDLASERDRRLLMVAGDAMASRDLASPAELARLANETRRRRGITIARAIAALVTPGVDSPMESMLRLTLLDGGLPQPEVNPDLYDEAGGWIGRPDLAYPELKIAIQYEGDVHRTNRQWQKDIARDEALRDHGWEIIRVTAAQLRHPALLCHRIRERMKAQAHRLGLV